MDTALKFIDTNYSTLQLISAAIFCTGIALFAFAWFRGRS